MADHAEDKESYSVEKAEASIFKRLKESLTKGEISPSTFPDDYLELHRIVDPNSQAGKDFQQEMEKVLKFLVPDPEFSEVMAQHPISFLLSDMKEANGYIIPTENQTIICLDKALFDKCENLNQFSYVVLHELTHLKIYDVFGEGQNSQTEEIACDVRPLRKMASLGLNMNEAKNIMKNISDKRPPAWMALIDAHPLPHHRVDIIESALGGMRVLLGTEAAAETKAIMPMPDELTNIVKNAKHESFIDKQCQASNFDALPAEAQIDVVAQWLPDLSLRYHNRITDARGAIKKIDADPNNPAHAQKLAGVIDAMMDNPAVFNVLEKPLEDKLFGDGERPYPEGRISQIAQEVNDFVDAESVHDIRKHAKRIMELYEQQPSRHIDWEPLGLPFFALETRKAYKETLKESYGDVNLPWHNHAESLKHDYNSDVIRALWLTGVFDPRLIHNATLDDCEWFRNNIGGSGFSDGRAILSVPQDETGHLRPFHLAIEDSGSLQQLIPRDNQMANAIFFCREYYAKIQERKESILQEQTKQDANFDFASRDANFGNVTRQEFLQRHNEILAANENALIADIGGLEDIMTKEKFAQSARDRRRLDDDHSAIVRKEVTRTIGNIRALIGKFDEWLADKDAPDYEACKTLIRDFFLDNKKLTVNYLKSVNSHEHVMAPPDVPQYDFINRPYLEFIGKDKHKLFSPQEKASLLDATGYPPRNLEYWRNTFNYSKPTNFRELDVILRNYAEFKGNSNKLISDDSHDDSLKSYFNDGSTSSPDNTLVAATTELAQYIKNHPISTQSGQSEPYVELMWHYPNVVRQAFKLTDTDLLITNDGKTSSPKKGLQKYIKESFVLPDDPTSFSPIYFCLADTHSFPSEKWRSELVNQITDRIATISNVDERIAIAESILLTNRDIRDVDIRQKTVELWVAACKEKYGLDDGSAAHLDTMKSLNERIGKNAVFNVRHEMLRQLGDAVISQRELSHAFEKTVYGQLDRSSLTNLGSVLGISQVVTDSVLKRDEAREAAIKFLIKPLTEESLKNFADPLASDMVSGLHDITAEDRRVVRAEFRRMHENFWSAPLPARSFVMKAFLFPAKERSSDAAKDEAVFQKSAEFAMQELLPLKTPDEMHDIQYAKESREFLRAFLAKGVLDENQRPLFVSALMSAVQKTQQQGTDVRIGQRLATLLEIMGPAWKKLGQAISSHPDTPRDIALDMEPLKGKLDMPRWQMWALYEDTVPAELRINYPTLGPILGSASFFTTVDAGDSVFAMQTPYAREKAADGFATMGRFIQELKTDNYNIGAAVPDSVADMVRSAQTSAALETNAKVGAAQAKALAQRYNGATVSINGTDYQFEAAQWYNYGPEFRHMKKMPGMVFNDLVKSAGTDSARLQAVHDTAKAVVALEIMHHLDGGVADYDRHGRNFVADGNKIGMFDVGATHAIIRNKQGRIVDINDAAAVDKALNSGGSVEAYQPGHKRYTDKKELALLGNALVESLKALQQDKPLAVVMHEQIEKARTEGKNPEHLIRVERGLLALQDCLRHLNNKGKDYTDVFAGVYNGGGKNSFVHGDIREVLEERVASGEFGSVDAKAQAALKAAGMLGMNKGQIMLNHYFKESANKPVGIRLGKATNIPDPQFWDIPKNTNELPSLCSKDDVVVKTQATQSTEKAEPLQARNISFHPGDAHGHSGSPMRNGEPVLTRGQQRLANDIGINPLLLQQRLNPGTAFSNAGAHQPALLPPISLGGTQQAPVTNSTAAGSASQSRDIAASSPNASSPPILADLRQITSAKPAAKIKSPMDNTLVAPVSDSNKKPAIKPDEIIRPEGRDTLRERYNRELEAARRRETETLPAVRKAKGDSHSQIGQFQIPDRLKQSAAHPLVLLKVAQSLAHAATGDMDKAKFHLKEAVSIGGTNLSVSLATDTTRYAAIAKLTKDLAKGGAPTVGQKIAVTAVKNLGTLVGEGFVVYNAANKETWGGTAAELTTGTTETIATAGLATLLLQQGALKGAGPIGGVMATGDLIRFSGNLLATMTGSERPTPSVIQQTSQAVFDLQASRYIDKAQGIKVDTLVHDLQQGPPSTPKATGMYKKDYPERLVTGTDLEATYRAFGKAKQDSAAVLRSFFSSYDNEHSDLKQYFDQLARYEDAAELHIAGATKYQSMVPALRIPANIASPPVIDEKKYPRLAALEQQWKQAAPGMTFRERYDHIREGTLSTNNPVNMIDIPKDREALFKELQAFTIEKYIPYQTALIGNHATFVQNEKTLQAFQQHSRTELQQKGWEMVQQACNELGMANNPDYQAFAAAYKQNPTGGNLQQVIDLLIPSAQVKQSSIQLFGDASLEHGQSSSNK